MKFIKFLFDYYLILFVGLFSYFIVTIVVAFKYTSTLTIIIPIVYFFVILMAIVSSYNHYKRNKNDD